MGLAERIVWAVPALGNLAATFRGWQFHRQRHGPVYRRTVVEILERDTWPRERILAFQEQELRRLTRHAATRVPHYRKVFEQRGLSPDDIQTVADLPKLPCVEKQTLRQDRLRFVDETVPVDRMLSARTSGSTGVPVRLLMTREAVQMHNAYLEARCRRVAGAQFGRRPFVMFGPQNIVLPGRAKPPFWVYNHVWKQLYMSTLFLSDRYLPAYVAEIRRRQYHMIMGFPFSLYTLARFMTENNEPPLSFETAITSGEMLYPEWRLVIEEAFGCRVFDQYGCSENCVFAAECPEGNMHLSPEYAVVEVVDEKNQPLPPGEVGELLCTRLLNYGQVLIRYRVGDRGALSAEPCPCGRPLPVLKSLDGRSGDALITRDGRRLSRVSSLMSGVQTVAAWQIVQDDIDRFRIRVVTDPEFSPGDSERLKRNLAVDLGDAQIDVEPVDEIERTAAGKAILLVCNVPTERVSEVTSRD